ncbi:hypothetical protein [Halosimplex amylolyticum]|uniref:hypothetical protein n=1 Tax=Halosimplex amylolyticum TaxID=3396616 RepID=UPI003F552619
MHGRTRRTFLGLGVGVAGALAGCLGGDPAGPDDTGTPTPNDGSGATDTPNRGTSASSLSFNRADRLRRVDAPFPQLDAEDHYLALLTADDHAAAFPTERFRNEDATAFLGETDFSQAALFVVHDRWSSSVPDLELRDVTVEGSTVSLTAEYPGEGGTDDVTTDTMLVRVRTDGPSVSAAEATIHPQYGDSIRLSTEDEDATTTTSG